MSTIDLTDFLDASFWDDNPYALSHYVGKPATDADIADAEAELGYKLPAAYVALVKLKNGGCPERTRHRTATRTSWSKDHVAITGIMGIDRRRMYSLRGGLGSQFMIDEWGYPPIGIVVCDCPSAGHDVIMLDYSACGPQGEPRVVHVDQEVEYRVTFVAENFEAFLRGLEHEDAFPEER